MTALFIFLWLLVGAILAFLYLVHEHRTGWINEEDQMWAFIIFLIPILGLAALLAYAGCWLMGAVARFIQEKF